MKVNYSWVLTIKAERQFYKNINTDKKYKKDESLRVGMSIPRLWDSLSVIMLPSPAPGYSDKKLLTRYEFKEEVLTRRWYDEVFWKVNARH